MLGSITSQAVIPTGIKRTSFICQVRLGPEYDVQMTLSDFDSDDQLSVIVDLR